MGKPEMLLNQLDEFDKVRINHPPVFSRRDLSSG